MTDMFCCRAASSCALDFAALSHAPSSGARPGDGNGSSEGTRSLHARRRKSRHRSCRSDAEADHRLPHRGRGLQNLHRATAWSSAGSVTVCGPSFHPPGSTQIRQCGVVRVDARSARGTLEVAVGAPLRGDQVSFTACRWKCTVPPSPASPRSTLTNGLMGHRQADVNRSDVGHRRRAAMKADERRSIGCRTARSRPATRRGRSARISRPGRSC